MSTFSTSERQKVVRTPEFLTHLEAFVPFSGFDRQATAQGGPDPPLLAYRGRRPHPGMLPHAQWPIDRRGVFRRAQERARTVHRKPPSSRLFLFCWILHLRKHYGNGMSSAFVEASLLCAHGPTEVEVSEGALLGRCVDKFLAKERRLAVCQFVRKGGTLRQRRRAVRSDRGKTHKYGRKRPKRARPARGIVDGEVSMEPAPSSPRIYSSILTDMSPLKKRRWGKTEFLRCSASGEFNEARH